MRWDDERYVRLYTRDTPEEIALGWEARALWREMLRKFDRAGILDLGKSGLRGLAGLTGVPLDVVERCMPILLDDGRIQQTGAKIIAPNYVEANETAMNSTARSREWRAKQREEAARDAIMGTATRGDAPQRTVAANNEPSPATVAWDGGGRRGTAGDSEPIRAEPIRAEPSGDQAPGFALSPSVPKPGGRRRGEGPTADQRYRAAFARGIVAGSGGLAFSLSGKVASVLGPAMAAHATRDGSPLTGADLDAWLEASTAEWRRVADPTYAGGWSPHAFVKWLNAGRPKAMPTRPIGDVRSTLQQPAADGEFRWKEGRIIS